MCIAPRQIYSIASNNSRRLRPVQEWCPDNPNLLVDWYRLFRNTNRDSLEPRKESLTRTYAGVEVIFTSRQTRAGQRTVHARARNGRPDSSAVIVFTSRGVQLGEPIVLTPGETFQGLLASPDEFGVQVQLQRVGERRPQDLLDRAKFWFEEHFTRRGSKIELSRPLGGRRG